MPLAPAFCIVFTAFFMVGAYSTVYRSPSIVFMRSRPPRALPLLLLPDVLQGGLPQHLPRGPDSHPEAQSIVALEGYNPSYLGS